MTGCRLNVHCPLTEVINGTVCTVVGTWPTVATCPLGSDDIVDRPCIAALDTVDMVAGLLIVGANDEARTGVDTVFTVLFAVNKF